MKTLRAVKTVLARALVIDAVFLNLFYLTGTLIRPTLLPVPSAVAWMLVQSLFLSVSFCFLFSDFLTAPLRLVLHFLATLGFFWLIFSMPGGYFRTGENAASGGVSFLVYFVFFTLVYAVAASVTVLVRTLTKSEGKEDPAAEKKKSSGKSGGEYRNQFTGGGEKR